MMLVLLVLGAAACGDMSESGSAGQVDAGDRSVDPAGAGAPEGGSEPRVIASGQFEGVGWRLLGMPAGAAEFLCLEAPSVAVFTCATAMVSGAEIPGSDPPGWDVLGMPSQTGGEPSFVFGSLEASVTRVAVELASGDVADAEVVGEDRGHYLAVVPPGASAVWVVAFGSDGEEVARRGFMGEELDELPEQRWESCGPTDGGGYGCEGGATVTGRVGGWGGVECDTTDDGEHVCEEIG